MATFTRPVGGVPNTSPDTFILPGNLSQYFLSNQSRVPQGLDLEAASSNAIMGLLNPPSMFPDVNRQAAEVTAGRGVGGSAAAYGTGLRMTDEERLRRIALGEQFLSGAYGRQPSIGAEWFGITPYQREILNQQQRAADLREQEMLLARGGAAPRVSTTPSYGGRAGAGVMASPWAPSVSPADLGYADWYGSRPTDPTDTYLPGFSYPNPSGALLPLYPGGEPVGPTGYDGSFYGGGYTPPLGTANYGDYTGIAGLENIGSGGLGDFSGLLDYYAGE